MDLLSYYLSMLSKDSYTIIFRREISLKEFMDEYSNSNPKDNGEIHLTFYGASLYTYSGRYEDGRWFLYTADQNDSSIDYKVSTGLLLTVNKRNDIYLTLERPNSEERNKGEDTFESISKELCDLHSSKDSDYGGSFSKTFETFGLTSSCIRLSDKVNRLNSIVSKSSQKITDESVEDTLKDLASYAIMTIVELRKEKK